MAAVRLVQLTDLHIVSTPGEALYGADPGAALGDAVASIHNLTFAPDAIIITGDIVQHGDQASYHRVKQLLVSLNLPIYVLPGNHDDPPMMESSLVGENIVSRFQTTIGNWRCLFLDSTVADCDQGRIGAATMENLRDALIKDKSTPTLIALHHPSTYECSAPDCQLQNREELLDTLKQYACVKTVIAGHVHCAAEETVAGIKLLATPSTFLHVKHHSRDPNVDHTDVRLTHTIDPRQRAYRILDLQDDGGINTEVCWY